MRQDLEQAAMISSPVVYSVSAAKILGVTVSDWVVIGTGVLLLMNLTLAGIKLYEKLQREDEDES